tara:strand:+ start:3067 stop:3423 length:357 start_codon:yes stop_codon:yes gene_type:complete
MQDYDISQGSRGCRLMSGNILDCQGHFDFERVALMAKKRFIDGIDTVTLMQQAKSEQERQEIVLIALLNLEGEQIKQLQLACPHELTCQVVDCQQRLRLLLKPLLKQHYAQPPPASID